MMGSNASAVLQKTHALNQLCHIDPVRVNIMQTPRGLQVLACPAAPPEIQNVSVFSDGVHSGTKEADGRYAGQQSSRTTTLSQADRFPAVSTHCPNRSNSEVAPLFNRPVDRRGTRSGASAALFSPASATEPAASKRAEFPDGHRPREIDDHLRVSSLLLFNDGVPEVCRSFAS